jgi:hypothetical protein
VKTVADWGLTARLPQPRASPSSIRPPSWTLVAGGDILLDRGVAQTVKVKGKGVDFPFDGGTAEITGHCKDCSPLGWDLPYTRGPATRAPSAHLVESADSPIANFENPARTPSATTPPGPSSRPTRS